MKASIVERNPQSWLGYHLQGPWQETVPRGFNQLKSWVSEHKVEGEWLAIYYGNPQELPPEELRVETVITAPEEMIPAAGDDIEKGLLPGGCYFHARVEVLNNDFFSAWRSLFDSLNAQGGWQVDNRPCFEHYLSDGSDSGDWLVDMYIPVRAVE
ncbi:GyrI-like domain-containing protein [Pantoea sp. SOD02]|uniref:GyrI-like domain-containing protein n=1 Tax=Pantoea sp. SOD02 TaxID=2970818 RepID=UPI002157A771|nr:GyrI-like domain-containing protein [Pantoea sp. SOD02]UVC27998.1 GyrI-like domain-containing protein [Pantoea sp. SOD02]